MRTELRVVSTEVEVPVYEPSDKFRRPGSTKKYVLATFHDRKGNAYCALVNIMTGESIHKLVKTASYDEVTADELAKANFTNPPAAKIQD